MLTESKKWLASHLEKLRHPFTPVIPEPEPTSPELQIDDTTRSRRWTLLTATRPRQDSVSHEVFLPLTSVTASAFDTTLQSLRHLGMTALFTLHVDIRCGIIHMLTKTMTGPEASLPTIRASEPATPSTNLSANWWHIFLNPPTAASSTVLQLNSDLIAFDAGISSYLGPEDHWFITSGLARFIDMTFVSCTKYIGAMNDNGALRLQLDVLILQQNLKNIVINPTTADNQAQEEGNETVALPRSAKFLDWFLEGGERALDYAQDEKQAYAMGNIQNPLDEPFTYDELKDLVELSFSEILKGPRGAENREIFMIAKKASAEAMLRLNEIMWDSK